MSLIKSQTEKIGSIFTGNKFIVPKYQRKYGWTGLEQKALWEDIEESMRDGMPHFLGTLSFKEIKAEGLATDTIYEIIDGQQRITTLFILLEVLIEKLENTEIQNAQMGAIIGKENVLKLHPLGEDGIFLNKLLFHYKEINPAEIVKRSQKFMYSAKENFLAFANSLGQQEIEEKIIFIRDNLEVLVNNIPSQAQAVKMFSSINDRGLPLRVLDKTKSILMLYSTLHLNGDRNDSINDSFEVIFDSYDDLLVFKDKLGILERFDENTVFTHHYFSSRRLFPETWHYRNSANEIFSNLKLHCEKLKKDDNALAGFINDYSSDFANFSKAYSLLIKEVYNNEQYQKYFCRLEFAATLYPLLVRLFMQKKLDALLQTLEVVDVRVYKLHGTTPTAAMYGLSSDVTESEMTVSDIKTRLTDFNEKFVNDYYFKQYLDDAIYDNGATKYILSEYIQQNISLKKYRDLTKEHIFCQDPKFDVSSYGFLQEDYNYEKNRLGNLCLLESSANKGNDPPISKVVTYLKSSINETQNLAGEIQKFQSNFNKENVDNRRRNIIEFCLERFKIK